MTLSSLLTFPRLHQQLPFDLSWLPDQAYLVGGAVRDMLLGRQREYIDWDFVLPENAIATARAIAEYYRVGFVVLDRDREIARVVFPQGTVDFALREGLTLKQDLQRRDFTINAIAYNLHQQELIDPLDGIQDIHKKQLKMIAAENLADDPLRLLRAYRQAAQLGFTIEPRTRKALQKLADLITTVAAERVQSELNYLLASSRGSQWLFAAYEDGLVLPWFPSVNFASLSHLSSIDSVLTALKNNLNAEKYLAFLANLGKKGMATAKLACLVTMKPEIAEQELGTLKYSRQEVRAIHALLTAYPRLFQSDFKSNLRSQYFFFLETGKNFPIFVLFALTQYPESDLIFYLLDRYLMENDPVAHPCPLLKGNDLIEQLKIKPSPLVGELLTEIQVAYIEGKIASRTEALDYASLFLQNRSLIENNS